MTKQTLPVQYWRCPNCGQTHFGETPPDMCDFCKDFTTWQALRYPDNQLNITRQPPDSSLNGDLQASSGKPSPNED